MPWKCLILCEEEETGKVVEEFLERLPTCYKGDGNQARDFILSHTGDDSRFLVLKLPREPEESPETPESLKFHGKGPVLLTSEEGTPFFGTLDVHANPPSYNEMVEALGDAFSREPVTRENTRSL